VTMVLGPMDLDGTFEFTAVYVPAVTGVHQVAAVASSIGIPAYERMAFLQYDAKPRLNFVANLTPDRKQITIGIQGAPFDTITLQVSTNLFDWFSTTPFRLDQNGYASTNLSLPGYPRQFYRARQTGQ